ncbi:uncharacterized protein SCHCODRAFT_01169153 [Schizophyllum commune H4-8]|nr:uncharacterized protein SCHCODRAFT_01169153 [Schizophyllum commune H4-8]KAI5894456.1 hypothetical protein SCHCODRAFT_01169153 [Schizophyllum commune H4-8]
MPVGDADVDFSEELRYPSEDVNDNGIELSHIDTAVRLCSPRGLLASYPALERAYQARDERDLAAASYMDLVATRPTMLPIADAIHSLADKMRAVVEDNRHHIPCPPMMSDDSEDSHILGLVNGQVNTGLEDAIDGLLNLNTSVPSLSPTAQTVASCEANPSSQGIIDGEYSRSVHISVTSLTTLGSNT